MTGRWLGAACTAALALCLMAGAGSRPGRETLTASGPWEMAQKTAPEKWMPAVVPGTVLATLVKNGVVPDPYWGLNNNRKWYTIIFVFFLLFNLIPIIGVWSTEGFLNVIQGTSLVNVGVEVMLIALGIAFALRHMKDKTEEAEG